MKVTVERGNGNMKMEIFMKENLRMENIMEMVNLYI
jgi:hypothetical protein